MAPRVEVAGPRGWRRASLVSSLTVVCASQSAPWAERPVANPHWCALTPTHRPHFSQTRQTLAALGASCTDTVRLFVAVTDFAEAADWRAFVATTTATAAATAAEEFPDLARPHPITQGYHILLGSSPSLR